MNRLKAVMLHLIANDAPLSPERRDHALKGTWADYRECHIGGDFLLIYRVDDTDGPGGSMAGRSVLVLENTGVPNSVEYDPVSSRRRAGTPTPPA